MNTQFSLYRLFLLIKRQILLNKKMILISGGAITGILFFLYFISTYNGVHNNMFHAVAYPIALFIGGYVISGYAFTDLKNVGRSFVFLTLPASTLEKYLSMFILTTIGWVLSISIIYYIFSLLVDGLGILILQNEYTPFNIFTDKLLRSIGVYLVTQSVFFLGSAYFRKNALFKTILALFVYGFAISIIVGILIRIFAKDLVTENNQLVENYMNTQFMDDLMPGIKNVFWYVTAPVFWVVAYFKLKETEI